MKPNRYLIAFMLCAAVLMSHSVYANGVLVVPRTTTQYVEKNAVSHGGFLRRLCGHPTESCGPRMVATTVTSHAIVADPIKRCTHPGYCCCDAQGHCYPVHSTWRCFPGCFVATPCHCCHHVARYLKPGSTEAKQWENQINIWESQNMQNICYVTIQDPGHFAHWLRRKHFDKG